MGKSLLVANPLEKLTSKRFGVLKGWLYVLKQQHLHGEFPFSGSAPVPLHTRHCHEAGTNERIMAICATMVNGSHAKKASGWQNDIPVWNMRQEPLCSYFVKKSIHSYEQRVLRTLLREAREQAGMTQTELSRKLGRSQSFVSKYEAGELGLDVLELRAICQAMGVSLPDFISRFEDRVS